ncbi:hypothetical protein CHGG_10395 [Chaetomium globosum CBS 148.51]|uniref:Elongator complex protein 1 n=1 Tax=Chaetomium globosum (strain ATCC 6205 / CBS 148.51 / DSM 1962 / NBRC 6347 / NRRL 1970) TaxID=306901 RepID=Q2GNQ9_CHAGB|nr:uncharacterized protein CHGG_10395 [Chaetomium globosum CBS 148.51]EAQ83991.1 hypothetical protein CHGG_10395 [Chaetomium globosum CBS 148.51]
MRNLRNIGHGVFRVPDSSSATALPISASCWDVSRDEVIAACGPTPGDARIELLRIAKNAHHISPAQLQSQSIASWDALSPNENGEPDAIVGMHYFSDTLTTCVIMAGGDMITVTEDEEGVAIPGEAHVEIVGTLLPSIAGARWSPDEELLVVATGDAKVVFMSRSWHVITEVGLSVDDLKLSKHVSVGWGKKETQFQGRGAKAKALRDPTIPEKVDEGTLSQNDDGRCSISWRGDGAYVAINFLQEGVRRVIRVYNRDGELDSVSEPVDGLDGSLSWRPEGNLIAGIQRLPDRVDVAFFERNGLRHGQFTLRAPADSPAVLDNVALEWNSDSTVLAVILKDRIQLWTMGNYHWYLKQEVLCLDSIGAKGQRPLFSWNVETPLRFAAAVASKVLVNEYALTVYRGPTTAPHDHGAVAVVDGQIIKFTPFRTCNPPPPMSMCELEVESPIIDVAFSTDCSSMAVLHRVGISFFTLEAKGPRLSNPKLLSMAPFGNTESQSYDESLLQVGFSSPRELHVLRMTDDLELLRCDFGSQEAKSWFKADASSIVTIASPGSASIEGLDVPADDPEKDERCRSIERGGRLVTAIPTKMALVLQMPRGNLETIYPRAMVLAGIRKLVEQKDYGSAFATCRTQRVDMNILFDHRPEQFLDNVGLFLDQVKDPANIDLFLSSLKEEDVTQTMYRDTKTAGSQPPDPKAAVKPGKTNIVCEAVLQRLRAQRKANLQNIITAHVCKSPPALDDGLLVVAELMQEDSALAERAVEHICFLADVNQLYDHALGLYNLDLTILVAQQSQRDPREYLPFVQELHKMPVLKRQFTIDDKLEHWEKALDHLKALNDFEQVKSYIVEHTLYQHALAIYRHEEQHHRAITDLFAAYLKSTSHFKEAGLAYESLDNFADATDCYLKAGATCWRECLYAAQQQNPPLAPAKLSEIATSLADALREAKDHASAATIHLDYLASVPSAIQHLCKGYLFADALRLAALHNRTDLLPTAIDTGLAEALSSSTEFLADCKAQLLAQVPRIAELRLKAREDPLAFYEGENPFGGRTAGAGADIPDDISVAASGVSTSASLFTRYTNKGGAGSVGTVGTGVSRATSKNRRREEKKRARGRKGTVYEEEYLVNSVRRLVERVEAATAEVERLVWGLARRGMAERARAVEELMAGVLEACRKAVGEVWPADDTVGGGGGGVGEGGVEPTRDPGCGGVSAGWGGWGAV